MSPSHQSVSWQANELCYWNSDDNYCFIFLLIGSSVLKLTTDMAILFLKSPEEEIFS